MRLKPTKIRTNNISKNAKEPEPLQPRFSLALFRKEVNLSPNPIATKVNPDMVRIFRGVSGSLA